MLVRDQPSRFAALSWVCVGAALCGCDGMGGSTVVVDADSPRPGPSAPDLQDDAVTPALTRPAAREEPVRRSEPREPRPPAARRMDRPPARADRRDEPASPAESMPPGESMPPARTAPGADPFDPVIDPATLVRPEPVAAPAAATPPALKDFPLTLTIPPDKQAIPADLALPAGTVLYHQDGRGWVEVELKVDAPPLAAGTADAVLRVHRTDRPAVIPDVRAPRDQFVIPKRVVRRLQSAR